MTEWRHVFLSLVAHMRGCGWLCAFVLQGRRFRPIGLVSSEQSAAVAHNDNRKL